MKDNILSFHMNPKYLDIIDKIRHFQADGPFKQQSPRRSKIFPALEEARCLGVLVEGLHLDVSLVEVLVH